MNAEQLHDAMSFLDDDLIEETDALRQGIRALPKKPKIIRWVVPAACLALVIGATTLLPPVMESSKQDSAIYEGILDMESDQVNGAPESAGKTPDAMPDSWQQLSLGGISLEIPADWNYELISGADETVYICFGTGGEMPLRVGFEPAFGVCGTGLREEETVIAGMAARVGYFDGGKRWSFAVFTERKPTYVIVNEGSEDWWAAHGDLATRVLDTIVIESEE